MMMTGEVELWYDDYCYECQCNGVIPMSMNDWWEALV